METIVPAGFPDGSGVRNPPANAGDVGSISGSGRLPGEGNDNPHQYLCLGNPWTEETGQLHSPHGHRRVRHDLVTKHHHNLYLLELL